METLDVLITKERIRIQMFEYTQLLCDDYGLYHDELIQAYKNLVVLMTKKCRKVHFNEVISYN